MQATTKKQAARKKIYLVNRDFQFRYAGAACVVGLLTTALTAIIILYPLYRFEILRVPRFLPWPILGIMIGAVLVNVAVVGLMGIFITHRLAGPMYSMVRYFRRVEEGLWFGALRLREGDELRYLVRNFNGMLEGIRRFATHDLDVIREVRAGLGEDGKAVEERLKAAEASLRELEESYAKRLKL